jgi:hypothetical protein
MRVNIQLFISFQITPTHSPGRREAAELSTEILDQFLEFIIDPAFGEDGLAYKTHNEEVEAKGIGTSSPTMLKYGRFCGYDLKMGNTRLTSSHS